VTKKLKTRDVSEAQIEAIKLYKEVKDGNYSEAIASVDSSKQPSGKIEVAKSSHLVKHFLAKYIGFLRNEGVPEHRVEHRSEEHIKDIERGFLLLAECLQKNGYNINTLSMEEINDKLVGKVYSYFLNEKKYSNRSVNKNLGYYATWIKWYQSEFDSKQRNWFDGVRMKSTNPNPQIISKEEFEALIEKTTKANGIKDYESGKKKFRSMYRPWLTQGFRLAIETGRRREEIINLKYNNIILDDAGNSCIRVEDYKVNRIQKRNQESEKKYIYIPITNSLQKLLDELGYEKNKDTENFILAPDLKIKRNKIMSDILSRGFSHFYEQLNTGKGLTFKVLRKTYITNLSIYMGGGGARSITGHSDDGVIERHYLNKQAVANAAKGFNVFNDQANRKNEIEQIRNNSTQKTKTQEIEK
jgi:integrase